MGNLYGLDIKYFVEVNFDGFKQIVDVMGGVTINVQVPVSDDRFPSSDNKLRRVYIPSGIQHMNGAEALRYARSRHGSSDFDRGARQQRVLLSLREQADPAGPHPAPPAADRRRSSRRSRRTSRSTSSRRCSVSPRRSTPRASAPTCSRRRSMRPTTVSTPVATWSSRRSARSARRSRPRSRPIRPRRTPARTWPRRVPRCGSSTGPATTAAGRRSPASSTSTASPRPSPRQRPAGAVPSNTSIVVYNGAEAKLPDTIAYLEQTFGVQVTLKDDPAIRADVVITVGKKTPNLEAPPSS